MLSIYACSNWTVDNSVTHLIHIPTKTSYCLMHENIGCNSDTLLLPSLMDNSNLCDACKLVAERLMSLDREDIDKAREVLDD